MATSISQPRRAVSAVRRVPVALEAAVAVLEHTPERVVGCRLEAPWADGGIQADLGVELPGGRYVAREVRIGFGPLLEEEDAVALPLWWQDAEHAHLFPAFDGGLELRRSGEGTELRLVGSYEPPFGVIGRFGDGLLGHRLVMASLERFLAGTAERLLASVATTCV